MTDLYKLLFLSSGAYYQASDELGYQPALTPMNSPCRKFRRERRRSWPTGSLPPAKASSEFTSTTGARSRACTIFP